MYTVYTKVALSHGDANYSGKMRVNTQEQCDSLHKNFVCKLPFCVYTVYTKVALSHGDAN